MPHNDHDADDADDQVLRAVELAVGTMRAGSPTRATVSFVGVEPIEVLRFAGARPLSLLTLGMSRHAMGADDAGAAGVRAELMIEVYADGDQLWRRLAVLAAAPVVEGVVYRDGMSVDLGVPLDPTSACTGGLIVASALPSVSTPAGEVQLLQVIPATSAELAFSRVHGSSALRDQWQVSGTDLLDLARSSVALEMPGGGRPA